MIFRVPLGSNLESWHKQTNKNKIDLVEVEYPTLQEKL